MKRATRLDLRKKGDVVSEKGGGKPKLKTKLEFKIDFDENELTDIVFTPREQKKKLKDILIIKNKKKNGTTSAELF